MEIIYHGHSCIQITSGRYSLIIDPFLSGNPAAKVKAEDIQVQYILLTHGHPDHVGDAIEIARRNDAIILCSYEMAFIFGWKGLKTVGMDIGGSTNLPFAQVSMVRAVHGSGLILEEEKQVVYGGSPGGFVVSLEGKHILHCGDTDLFTGMQLIGDKFRPDLVFIPIGDLFTMGPGDAVRASKWLQAQSVVPIHYNSFPPIRQDGQAFIRELEKIGIRGLEMTVGQTYPFDDGGIRG
jgi:L-ascorbate metabolism protein UlaG (beta-lactamase superfamily)